jgi:hypothetical protein
MTATPATGAPPARPTTALDRFLIEYLANPAEKATAIASSFAASLELVREGQIEIRQTEVWPARDKTSHHTDGDRAVSTDQERNVPALGDLGRTPRFAD